MNLVLIKWIEPYVLLEKIKEKYEIEEYIFDGFSKNETKRKFIDILKTSSAFGLYMKNVNKFYVFKGNINPIEFFMLDKTEFIMTKDTEEALNMIDMGKAEASFFNCSI